MIPVITRCKTTHLGIPEEAVGAPWERLDTSVEVVVGGNLRKLSAVLVPRVRQMLFMFLFSIANPCKDGEG